MKIIQIGEDGDLDFQPYKIHKVKFTSETEDAVFLRNYNAPTSGNFEGFMLVEGVDVYTLLDNFRIYAFGVDYNESQDVPEAFTELGEGGFIPEGLELDFTLQPEEQIPTNFQNCDIEVECTPKWEINANTLRIHLPYADTQDACTVRLMWKLDSHYIMYGDGNAELISEHINNGNYAQLSSWVRSSPDYTADWALDNTGGVTMNIRGDLSRLLGIKIICNEGLNITGLGHCTNLELLDIYNSVDGSTEYASNRPFWDERTVDVIPASVKYLYLDFVKVTDDCLAFNPVIFNVYGHSPVFTNDPFNFIGEGTKIFKYYTFNGFDDSTYIYENPKFKVQRWQAKDLRSFYIQEISSRDAMENFIKSLKMYLEPNPHPFEGAVRFIHLGIRSSSPADYYTAENDYEVANWLSYLNYYKPGYTWGEY